MTVAKRLICVLLSLVMLFSAFSSVSLGAEEIEYSFRYYTSKPDTYNAERTLDMIDELLYDNRDSLYFEVKQNTLFGGERVLLTLDLTSVDNICKTVDDYKFALKLAGPFMGDLKN
ncbi:MAG: hypothetical protein II356_01175, partial [Clostridia bacterium]|nr:hypothetical protein [Clostridia bacterium]